MLHRGAKASEIAPTLRLTNINPFDTNNKVRALVDTLTTLKGNAENIFNVHKHANNKREHSNSNDNSYDPSVSKNLLEYLLHKSALDIYLAKVSKASKASKASKVSKASNPSKASSLSKASKPSKASKVSKANRAKQIEQSEFWHL